MSVCVTLPPESAADPNVLPVLSEDRPLRLGDALDFYVSFENFLYLNENEQVVARAWTTNGPVSVLEYGPVAELAIDYEGVEYRYLRNERVLLGVAVDAEEGPAQVFCKITTDRGRISTVAFQVTVSDWPELA